MVRWYTKGYTAKQELEVFLFYEFSRFHHGFSIESAFTCVSSLAGCFPPRVLVPRARCQVADELPPRKLCWMTKWFRAYNSEGREENFRPARSLTIGAFFLSIFFIFLLKMSRPSPHSPNAFSLMVVLTFRCVRIPRYPAICFSK